MARGSVIPSPLVPNMPPRPSARPRLFLQCPALARRPALCAPRSLPPRLRPIPAADTPLHVRPRPHPQALVAFSLPPRPWQPQLARPRRTSGPCVAGAQLETAPPISRRQRFPSASGATLAGPSLPQGRACPGVETDLAPRRLHTQRGPWRSGEPRAEEEAAALRRPRSAAAGAIPASPAELLVSAVRPSENNNLLKSSPLPLLGPSSV